MSRLYVEVHNMRKLADDEKFIVARNRGGEFWFWGAYTTLEEATKAANSLGGNIIKVEEVRE